MPKGVPELKRRNGGSRLRYHRNQIYKAMAQSFQTAEIKRLVRRDLATGREEVITETNMRCEVIWSENFQRWNNYAMESSIVRTEMEKGATFYTDRACFWLEANLAAQKRAA